MALPSYVAAGAFTLRTGAGTIEPPLPAGLSTGDYMVAFAVEKNTALTLSIEAGWDLIGRTYQLGQQVVWAWGKFAEVGEAAPVITSGAAGQSAAVVAAWSGVDATVPFEQAGRAWWSFTQVASFNPRVPATRSDNAVAVAFCSSTDDNALSVAGTGWTQRFGGGGYDAPNMAFCMGTSDQATQGTPATPTFTLNVEGSDFAATIAFSLRGDGEDAAPAEVWAVTQAWPNFTIGASPLVLDVPWVLPGDILVATMLARANPLGVFSSTGWTVAATGAVASTLTFTILYRIADGTEGTTASFAYDGTINMTWGFVSAYSNVDPANVLDDTPPTASTASSTTMDPPAITTLFDGSLVICAVGTVDNNTNSLSTASGFEDIASGVMFDTLAGNDASLALASKIQDSAGSVTLPQFTQTQVGPDTYLGLSVGLRLLESAAPILVDVGTVIEVELAQPITPLISREVAVGTATERELANQITASIARLVAVGTATERELANPIDPVIGRMVDIGTAMERELANPITPLLDRLVQVGTATEVETANPFTAVKPIFVDVGTATEVETAVPIFAQRGEPFIPAVECNTITLPVACQVTALPVTCDVFSVGVDCELVDAYGQNH